MADLEELGFVASPHTSAGRIPTAKGYRFFVDTLLKVRPFDGPEADAIRRGFDRTDDPRTLVATASQMLSNLTQMAGLVTLPSSQSKAVTHIEFLPLSQNRVLAVIVFDNGEV